MEISSSICDPEVDYSFNLSSMQDKEYSQSAFKEVKSFRVLNKSKAQSIDFSFFFLADDVKREFDKFNILINNRILYLNSLRELDNQWIDGGANVPDHYIIEFCVDLLKEIRTTYSAQLVRDFEIAKLIMGPIRSGGISLEFKINEYNSIYLNVFNNREVEVCKKSDDFFEPEFMLHLQLGRVANEIIGFIIDHGFRDSKRRFAI